MAGDDRSETAGHRLQAMAEHRAGWAASGTGLANGEKRRPVLHAAQVIDQATRDATMLAVRSKQLSASLLCDAPATWWLSFSEELLYQSFFLKQL